MVELTRCIECGSDRLESSTETETRVVDGRTFTADLPAQKCAACGEVYFDLSVLGTFDRLIAGKLAEAGASSGEAFRFMRKTIGMRAAELAELLAVAPETISRWENGQRDVDRGAIVTLGSLVLDRIEGRSTTLDRLRALREPPRPAETIALDVREHIVREVLAS